MEDEALVWDLQSYEDATGAQWLTAQFDTLPGAYYILEKSDGLQDWIPWRSFYALSDSLHVALAEVVPAQAPPQSGTLPPLPTVPRTSLSFTMRPLPDSSGIGVTWSSLDPQRGLISRSLTGSLTPAWGTMPFFIGEVANYSLFIAGLPDSPWMTFQDSTPEERSPADDLAFATLQSHFVNIQQTVVANHATAQSQPVLPPSEAGDRGFYRLARFFPDSDGDGLPDAVENALGLGDPFNADSDGDGVSDGAEDDDGDGIPNQYEYEGGSDPNDANSKPPPLLRYQARGLTFNSFTSTADSGSSAVGISLRNELSTLGTSIRTAEPNWKSRGRNATLLFEDGSYRWALGTGSFAQAKGDFSFPVIDPEEEPFVNDWGWGKTEMVPIGQAKAAADEATDSTFSELEYRKDTTLQLVLTSDLASDYRTRRQVPLVAVRRDGGALGAGLASTSLPSIVYPSGVSEHRLLDFLIPAQKTQSNLELFDTAQYPLANASEGGDALHFFPVVMEGLAEGIVAATPPVDEASGVDRSSLSAEPGSTGATDRLWVMVPAGGGNRVRVSTGEASAELPVKLIAGPATTTPATLTQASEVIIWSAPAAAVSSEHTLQLQFGDAAPTEVPIGIHIMEKRIIDVAIHPIARRTASGGSEPPALLPSETELTEYLNHIYRDQINLEFNVVILPIKTVNWDIADGRQAGAPPFYLYQMIEAELPNSNAVVPIPASIAALSAISVPQDRMFDLSYRRSPEQIAVVAASQTEPAAHLHVFLIGGMAGMRVVAQASSDRLEQEGLANGFAVSESRVGEAEAENRPGICWVDAERSGTGTIADVIYTVAHEIGHVIVGAGHPDEGGGVAPLGGSNHPLRLLLSGGNPDRLTPHGIQLVKEEWVAADARLPGILDRTNSPQ